jgi:hypothetical protein
MQLATSGTPALFVVILYGSDNYAPASMKYFVLEKTKYILNNSWIGLLIPAGVHQLLNIAEKSSVSADKPSTSYKSHPAETRISRTITSKARP